MDLEQEPKYVIVPKRIYDALKLAGMDIGCVPQQRIPDESFCQYVKRVPRAPK